MRQEEIEQLHEKLQKQAESSGYQLNPDLVFAQELVRGLLINQERYGYQACPCRLAAGKKENDLDIICPCDYRDADLEDFDACYCGLYVNDKISKGEKKLKPIPERRAKEAGSQVSSFDRSSALSLTLPVWRCKVCGYLCARGKPPETCPICKVKKERFARFI